jgi:hypothetical protein
MYLFSSLLSAIDTLPVNMAQEFFSFTYSPDILIYDKFSYPDLPTLLEKDIDSNYMDDYSHECFSTNHKLLIIPSGENGGHVILTSLYTDWGYAHSQATSAEIKIMRDLVTFAKNPNLPIPMYNLEENAKPEITLDVVVKNNTDSPAGKVKVIVSDPNREIVLYESEEACISNCKA